MRPIHKKAQTDLFDEIIVVGFAGGGGSCTGISEATGRVPDIAINHDAEAIRLHQTNYPFTEHYQSDIFEVDPRDACRGRQVGLAWFSPDCRHFSKAKGKPLVNRKIRGLSWVVLKWAMDVRPRVLMMENVEEIQTWGPLIPAGLDKDGNEQWMPDPERKGETFQGFLMMLSTGISKDHPALLEACEFLEIDPKGAEAARLCRGLGYRVEHRELVAADYGAPTTRKRFAMVARCDGRPIIWPEKTYGPRDSEEVRSGKLLPWRSAAEIIDWSQQTYSIFATRQEIKEKYGVNAIRPLADNTLRRIIRGVDKFTIKSGKPFIVPTGYGERKGQAPRVHDIEDPVPTVVSTCKQNLVQPVMAPITFSNTGSSVGTPADRPVHTIRSAGGQALACANLIQYHTEQTENARNSGLDAALPTVDGANRHGLVSASLVEYFGNGNPLDLKDPLHTVTARDREALTSAILQPFHAGGYHGKGNSPAAPVNTITSSGGQSMVLSHIVEFKGQDIGQRPDKPLRTITASAGEFAVAEVKVARREERTEDRRPYGYWPEIRALLNKYCGYALEDDEILLLQINDAWYYITDISMRMLTPRELYNAMGFPPDYIIDHDWTGREYHKTQQVAKCGNAVPPPMARALVWANFPEWRRKGINTMEELEEAVAV